LGGMSASSMITNGDKIYLSEYFVIFIFLYLKIILGHISNKDKQRNYDKDNHNVGMIIVVYVCECLPIIILSKLQSIFKF